MKFLRYFFISLFALPVFSAAAVFLSAAQANSPPSPEQLRLRIVESVGQIPRNSEYRLEGRFTLSATGESVLYQARVVQAYRQIAGKTIPRRAADFTHENRTRNLRFFLSGETAWASSPEITVDAMPEQIPYMARFDFHTLYAELLDILDRGTNFPEFRVERADNEIRVYGRLQNGWNAVFTLNAFEFYPRKVKISTDGEKTAAWMIPYVSLGNVWLPQLFPESTTEFEIWMSNPVSVGNGGYRYAQRLDFLEQDVVVGSFFIEGSRIIVGSGAETEDIFVRPPVFPWDEGIRFKSAGSDSAVIFSDDSLYALRSRLDESPWSKWNRHSRALAYLSIVYSVFSSLLLYPVPPKVLGWVIVSGYVVFLFLLFRFSRPRRPGVSPRLLKFPRKTAIAGLFVGIIMFIAGFSAWMMHLPIERSRMALHAAIRFAVTEREVYATGANLFLMNFALGTPAETWEDRGRSAQNYALAYDLIRKNLTAQRRAQLETDLFEYARPLLGAASGWPANGPGAAGIASGLGLTGLVIDFEPFITASESVIEQMLSDQLSGGLHRAGPGPGNADMNAAVNLFHGLRRAGRADYYADARFQEYVSTTLRLLSPAGTLPLFGGTSLDDSLGLSLFLLKIADKMPEETGGRCVAAHNLYMEYGIFYSEGWVRRIASRLLPFLAYYENPHVLLQYESAVKPLELPEESFATGDGQFAALRAGSGAEAMYLALNMLRSGSRQTSGDALSFDLFAKSSLMLHGSVLPQESDASARSDGNTPVFNDDAQIMNESAGITSALLNQPVFDSARAVADKTYAYGQVKRDVIMVRPEENFPGYFVIMDDVSEVDVDTTVRWRIHGRGETATGLDQRIRWKSTAFGRPRLWKERSLLQVVNPFGVQGNHSTSPGTLRSRFPFFDQPAQSVQVEWSGVGRLCSILFPYGEKEQPPIIETQGEYACRIGAADWFSFGELTRRITLGWFEHVSEYSLVRSRGQRFPALFMAFGVECRFGEHSIVSDKPVTASLDGPRGGFQNNQPDTSVIIRSPEINHGTRFFLDGHPVPVEKPGVLVFTLSEPGTHLLSGQ
ncbi:MAG: hypothetical protein FWF13_03480 [Acidobacteria bacterium]|nr:hypothetical protein [Acidobacteriota bacterium]